MSTPYRDNAKPAGDPLRKYMRLKARVRGLWRRVVGPTTFICVVGGLFTLGNVASCSESGNRGANSEAMAKRHFDDWQKMIDDNQAKMNVRQVEIDKKEAELNSRVRNFEDLVSVSPALLKNGDSAPIVDALKRVKQPNK